MTERKTIIKMGDRQRGRVAAGSKAIRLRAAGKPRK